MGLATRFAVSRDGKRIAYDVTGSGRPIVLLHGGLICDRSSWRDAGYVERLSKEFSVISIDLRGHGESDAPELPEDYSAGKLVADIQTVAEACGVNRFAIWGYSFGATVALHAASRSEKVLAAVIAGSYFGPVLSPENFQAIFSSFENMIAAKDEGRLADMPEDRREFVEKTNLRAGLAIFRAMSEWRSIEPEDVLCPVRIYCGTKNEHAMEALQQRSAQMKDAQVQFEAFEGIDHTEEFQKIEIVYEPAITFLRSALERIGAGR